MLEHAIGGLSTSFPSLKANLLLSTAVAITGISVPIALSFSLQGLAGASPLQAFAAGAALCSTSLGTTFTILGTSGLAETRLGTVLTSAAMMDDVVGLVMVQIISNLGGSASSFSAITVIRPVFVSIAFAASCPLACVSLAKPLTVQLNRYRSKNSAGWVNRTLSYHDTVFALHTALLIAMVTGSTYAGTSNLFATYLAGAMVSWWDSEVPHPETRISEPATSQPESSPVLEDGGQRKNKETGYNNTGKSIYRDYYSKAVDRILKPFFFVSATPGPSSRPH